MLPKTRLLTAPAESENMMGKAIMSTDLLRKLKKLNPEIRANMEYSRHVWYPMQDSGGTCLWIGEPGGESVKITGFTPGPIPEFTMLNEDGTIIKKGWRAIFEKVIGCGLVSREKLSRAFQVNLNYEHIVKTCRYCLQKGKISKSTSKSGFCDLHDRLLKIAIKGRKVDASIHARRKTAQGNPFRI